MSNGLDQALALAQRGFRVFPLKENGTTPAIKDWPVRATTDPDRIKELWTDPLGQTLDYNPAIATGDGVMVLDFDCKDNKPGVQYMAALDAVGELPNSLRATTPSGGKHLILACASEVANSVSKIAAGVDVRGRHGYIVGPGSVTARGVYAWENGSAMKSLSDLEPAPDWIVEKAGRPRERKESDGAPLVDLDDESAVAAARDWLTNHAPEAIEGAGGDFTTYSVAAKVKDFGVSRDTALELMLEHWNEQKAQPPWMPHELESKIENAYTYGTSPPGVSSARGEFSPVVLDEKANLYAPTPFDVDDLDDIPPRQWIVKDILARNFVTALIAPSGAGKTQFLSQLALAIASGQGEAVGFEIKEPTKVWYWNQEDDMDELRRRLASGAQAHNISRNRLRRNLFVDSGVGKPLMLVARDPNTGIVKPTREATALADFIKANGIGVFIADPLIEFHNINENDNSELNKAVRVFRDHIANKANCAVVVAHHTRKPPGASSEGFAGNQDASRGGAALQGVTRVMLSLYQMSEADMKLYQGVEPHNRHHYVRLDDAKSNLSLAAAGADPFWFKRISVQLGIGGEEVGALEPVSLRRSAQGITESRIEAIADLASRYQEPVSWAAVQDHLCTDERGNSRDAWRKWLVRMCEQDGTEIKTSIGTLQFENVFDKGKRIVVVFHSSAELGREAES